MVLLLAVVAFLLFAPGKSEEGELSCNFRITCAELLGKADALPSEKRELIGDGEIFPAQTVHFSEGESVFDVLKRVAQREKIHMEFSHTPVYDSNYIEGINNLYEFDCGATSGWIYSVNGEKPNYSSSLYKLSDGDTVEWSYTTEKTNW